MSCGLGRGEEEDRARALWYRALCRSRCTGESPGGLDYVRRHVNRAEAQSTVQRAESLQGATTDTACSASPVQFGHQGAQVLGQSAARPSAPLGRQTGDAGHAEGGAAAGVERCGVVGQVHEPVWCVCGGVRVWVQNVG